MSGASSAPNGATPSNIAALPRNATQLLATRLQGVALGEIARALGCDDSTACRVRSGEAGRPVSDLCKLIDVAGLKLVDKTKVCVDRQAYESLTYIAGKAMADQETAQRLIWDEDQA